MEVIFDVVHPFSIVCVLKFLYSPPPTQFFPFLRYPGMALEKTRQVPMFCVTRLAPLASVCGKPKGSESWATTRSRYSCSRCGNQGRASPDALKSRGEAWWKSSRPKNKTPSLLVRLPLISWRTLLNSLGCSVKLCP